MTRPALSKEDLVELLETLSRRLQRKRAVARLYVIGAACMTLAYGRGRSTEDVDARVDAGHGALVEAAHEIARERGLPAGWLNEQATAAIPREPDRRARTLFESPHLVVTGASPESLLAMKLEAGRDKDVEDIAHLLGYLGIKASDAALAVHAAALPDSRRRAQARALLEGLAAKTPGLAPPTGTPATERAWLATLASDDFPRYERVRTAKGLALTVRTERDAPPRLLGEGLTLQGLALIECDHRGWPEAAVAIVKGFTAAELAEPGRVR